MTVRKNNDLSHLNRQFKILLGYTKRAQYGDSRPVYLEGFKWDCGWYWGGGYIGNKDFHAHFDDAFLDVPDIRGHVLGNFVTPWTRPRPRPENSIVVDNGCSIWEPIETFLDKPPAHISRDWWRVKDLYKQFYRLKAAAEVFHLGGHCTSEGRTAMEIDPVMGHRINLHIGTVIIPEICKVLGV